MASETINLTAAELLDGAGTVDGRVSVGLDEIKRRLEQNLPGLITLANTREGYTSKANMIRTPDYYAAGPIGSDENDSINAVFLAASNVTDFQGNNQFNNDYVITIYSVDARIVTEDQYKRHWDRAGLIRVALAQFLDGAVDALGRVCWRQLRPMAVSVDVDMWDQYAGLPIEYRMLCDPSQNVWS